MRSELIHGAAKSDLDAKVVQFISKHSCGASPHMNMSVAISNEAGKLYRLIIADGIIELIRVDKFLVSIGCIEEFVDEFDALFSVPPRRSTSRRECRACSEG